MSTLDRTIWKYFGPLDDSFRLKMPSGARVLHATLNTDRLIVLWAEVDPDAPTVRRTIHVRGTGHPIRGAGTHVATVIDGAFVWHIYDGGESSL